MVWVIGSANHPHVTEGVEPCIVTELGDHTAVAAAVSCHDSGVTYPIMGPEIMLTPPSVSIAVGDSAVFRATARGSDTFRWTSSEPYPPPRRREPGAGPPPPARDPDNELIINVSTAGNFARQHDLFRQPGVGE